jgi:hypothetical protein
MNNQPNELQPVAGTQPPAVTMTIAPSDCLLNRDVFTQLQRAAALYSESGLVPDQFKKNVAACFVGLQLAAELKISPFMLFQKLYIVRGKPAIEAQLAIALANRAGVFASPIEYRFDGEGQSRKCTAFAILAATKKRVEATVSWETVEAEGWANREGTKWRTMPDLMFRYRSAMWLIRTYCPEVILGLHSRDEIEDAIDITPHPAQAAAAIGEAVANSAELTPQKSPPSLSGMEAAQEKKPEPEPKAKSAKPKPTTPPLASNPEPKPAPKAEEKPGQAIGDNQWEAPQEEIRKAIDEIHRLMPDAKKIPVATSRALGLYKKLSECSYDELLRIIVYLEGQPR